MADAAIKANISNTDVLLDWALLKNHTAKMSEFRNEAAHGMLANFDNQEMKIMPYGTDILKRKEALTVEILKARTKLFVDLQTAISWFHSSTSNQIKPSPHFHNMPVPETILDLRSRANG
jgi:hypothetical protein